MKLGRASEAPDALATLRRRKVVCGLRRAHSAYLWCAVSALVSAAVVRGSSQRVVAGLPGQPRQSDQVLRSRTRNPGAGRPAGGVTRADRYEQQLQRSYEERWRATTVESSSRQGHRPKD